MSRGRGASGLSGILAVDKPAGLTSHDVVSRLRKATGERRIGHAGTLDPAATGLLVVLIGQAARLARYITGADKSYEAVITFGRETDTLDGEGDIVTSLPVPDRVRDPGAAQAVLDSFRGVSLQAPPVFSAIKTGGTAAHRIARRGGDPGLAEREITVHSAVLLGIDTDPDRWTVAFTVSKGTYVRSLARDIGRAMGTVAFLSALRRTGAGPLDIAGAHALEEIERAATERAIENLFIEPLALLGLPTVVIDPADVRDGRPLPVPAGLPLNAERVACVSDGRLLAVYVRAGDALRAETVLPGGVG